MAKNVKSPLKPRETINATKVNEALHAIVRYIIDKFGISDDVAIVGIQTRGAVLAHRIVNAIKKEKGVDVPFGALDITLYRDDLTTSGIQPIVGETNLDFDINDKRIILIDDVLFTGRTIRAALDELIDFGRPKSITLIVLVDRGHRELPIEAQFAPIKIATKRSEAVNLSLSESDGNEEIVVGEPIAS